MNKKDVIVIGAGVSGLTCSVKLAEYGNHVKLFSPSPPERSQSVMAMGGINAALDNKGQDDSPSQHYTDTIKGGHKINNHKAVKKLTNNAPKIIEWLSQIGTSFTRDENNNIDQRYFGGQKKKRTVYAGTRTGKQIITAINTRLRKYEHEHHIEHYAGWRFLSLILNKENECKGVILINELTDEIKSFTSDNVVIATGGMNKIFGKISGSQQNDGGTTARLFLQQIKLANLEMIQYHPTTIKTPVKNMLITEAARAEGGRLYTIKNNQKWYFMEEWYPEQGALMPRDVVTQSIYKVCNQYNMGIDGENKVYLDISFLPEETVKTKLEEIYEICTKYLNMDPTKEPIPVYPCIHYFMGGILTDENHKTSIKNLYAIGECSTQYHGANRLGGNSLLGAIHGGITAAKEINKKTPTATEDNLPIEKQLEKEQTQYNKWKQNQSPNNTSSYKIEEELVHIMNNAMSIYREEITLKKAIQQLKQLEKEEIYSHNSYYEYVLIKSLIPLAKAFLKSAIERKESRGAHQRIDYPEKDEKYQKTTVIQQNNNQYNITFNKTDEQMRW
ncbi:FAD-binding protein [Methanosphaera sp. ISO3-F5]|uniref:FAD-binding protein n=1 Tax=Methanosphaera sp. ISO3-F5 TaxID=1452353 RepID=UPI002B25849C|nr:FAD-binding protein [Methanosphaera sp. ISO3-F5]WQH63642.1 FAD-binding protein [Methanosphaera sp. ISO3-F5]